MLNAARQGDREANVLKALFPEAFEKKFTTLGRSSACNAARDIRMAAKQLSKKDVLHSFMCPRAVGELKDKGFVLSKRESAQEWAVVVDSLGAQVLVPIDWPPKD